MRDITAELKDLRLHGMVDAWSELMTQGESRVASCKERKDHFLSMTAEDQAGGEIWPLFSLQDYWKG